jgi:hypothetical protein
MTITREPLCRAKVCPRPSDPDFHRCAIDQQEPVDHQHIEPRGMGGSKARDVASNIICLCRPCHEKITRHEWRDNIMEVNGERYYAAWDIHGVKLCEVPLPGVNGASEGVVERPHTPSGSPLASGAGKRGVLLAERQGRREPATVKAAHLDGFPAPVEGDAASISDGWGVSGRFGDGGQPIRVEGDDDVGRDIRGVRGDAGGIPGGVRSLSVATPRLVSWQDRGEALRQRGGSLPELLVEGDDYGFGDPLSRERVSAVTEWRQEIADLIEEGRDLKNRVDDWKYRMGDSLLKGERLVGDEMYQELPDQQEPYSVIGPASLSQYRNVAQQVPPALRAKYPHLTWTHSRWLLGLAQEAVEPELDRAQREGLTSREFGDSLRSRGLLRAREVKQIAPVYAGTCPQCGYGA